MHVKNKYAKQKLMTHLDQKNSPISYIKQSEHKVAPDSHLTFALGRTENQQGRP